MNVTSSLPRTLPASRWTTCRRIARSLGIAMFAGLVSGIFWGIVARIAMRIIALAAHQRPAFSVAGTVGIVTFTALGGIVLGIVFLVVPKLVRGGWLRQGLAFGGFLLLTIGTLLYNSSFKEEAVALRQLPLTIALFAPLLVVSGMIVASVYRQLDRRLLVGPRSRAATVLGVGMLALPALFIAVMVTMMALVATGVLPPLG